MNEPIYESWQLQEKCEEIGGRFDEPDDGVFRCSVGGAELVLYGGTGKIEARGDTTWEAQTGSLSFDGSQFVVDGAEGNPGPPGPMYVDDAEVRVDRLGVDAMRTQRL